MITLDSRRWCLEGASWQDLHARFPQYDAIRQVERASIRAFLETHREYLRGRVLDLGAGEQPYRDLVEGEYVPYEKGDRNIPAGPFNAVLCTQVLQYVDAPANFLRWGAWAGLARGGHLVLSYPTAWDEVEVADLWRFTKYGMEKVMRDIGFVLVAHERRAEVAIDNFKFPLGYGLIARK